MIIEYFGFPITLEDPNSTPNPIRRMFRDKLRKEHPHWPRKLINKMSFLMILALLAAAAGSTQ